MHNQIRSGTYSCMIEGGEWRREDEWQWKKLIPFYMGRVGGYSAPDTEEREREGEGGGGGKHREEMLSHITNTNRKGDDYYWRKGKRAFCLTIKYHRMRSV